MGGSESTPDPNPLFDNPWRDAHWGESKNLQLVRQFKPERKDITHLRILLYGPVGAGKSSFFNSVKNALLQRNTHGALANACNDTMTFTKTFETHQIRKGKSLPREYYPFVFSDVMGLEDGIGVRHDDIILALKGHVKEGYTFNPVAPLPTNDTRHYVSSPAADDKVHVLVTVLNANVSNLNKTVVRKMAEVREAASALGIPQIGILTNIDGACGQTKRYLRNVYRSKYLKKTMEEYSHEVGLPMNCIFPVQNYFEEDEVNADTDTLILNALKQIISFGEDHIDTLEKCFTAKLHVGVKDAK